MNKSKIYLDLSKCTEEQTKHIISLLPEPIHEFQYAIDSDNYMLDFDDGEFWVNDTLPLDGKQELTYPEFIKLFEGGEVEKSDLEVWLIRQIEKCQQLDMPREEWAYIQVLKKINSNQ